MDLCAEMQSTQRSNWCRAPFWISINGAGCRATLICRQGLRVLSAGGRRLIAAARRVAQADMTAVSTVCKVHMQRCLLRRDVGGVDAVAKQVVRRDIEARAQNATDAHPLNNNNDIIRETAAIWEPGRIAGDRPERQRLAFGVGGTPVLSRIPDRRLARLGAFRSNRCGISLPSGRRSVREPEWVF